jgi:molybdenum cofactor cytidylyltransferase
MYGDGPDDGPKNHNRFAVIVLGAGLSSRFGKADKLGALVAGKPLSHHILSALHPFDWTCKTLVCQGRSAWVGAYVKAGFAIVENAEPERGMLSSLRLGVNGMADQSMVMVCLADMPFVTADHIARLLSLAASTKDCAVASQAADYRGPPAIFSAAELKKLPASGEGGARSLLAHALFIACPTDEVRDIDTNLDLKQANNR